MDRTRNPGAPTASRPCASGVPGSAMPCQRSAGSTGSAGEAVAGWSITGTRIGTTLLSSAALHDVEGRTIIGRPLASRALPENAAQAQEDKYGQRQEDDGVDIHVDFAFWSLPATGRPSKRSRSGTAEITSPIESAACRHETMLGQWRFLARASASAF